MLILVSYGHAHIISVPKSSMLMSALIYVPNYEHSHEDTGFWYIYEGAHEHRWILVHILASS